MAHKFFASVGNFSFCSNGLAEEHSNRRNSFENFCFLDCLEDAGDTDIYILVIDVRVSVGVDSRLKNIFLVLLLAWIRKKGVQQDGLAAEVNITHFKTLVFIFNLGDHVLNGGGDLALYVPAVPQVHF